MKRLLTVTAALMLGILTFIFTGCSSGGGHIVYPNSMTATVAGVLSFSASGSLINATSTNGTLNITATTASKANITMTVPSFSGVAAGATLAINSIGTVAGATYDSLGTGHALLASRGAVSFTSVSPYLEGTFSFVCSDSTAVTVGTFKIKAP